MADTRKALIQDVWPDKILYGTVMLLVTAGFGVLFGLVLASDILTLSPNLEALLTAYPPVLSLALSAVTGVLAYLAVQRRDTTLALAGAGAGILSFSMLGLGTLLSVMALGFVLLARREGEDARDAGKAGVALTADMWPDKSLAASLLVLMQGIASLAWGLAVATGAVQFTFLAPLFGPFALLAGALGVYAARELYFQRAPALGLAAAVVGVLAAGFYIMGPLLGLGALYLIAAANAEGEFETPGAARGKTAA